MLGISPIVFPILGSILLPIGNYVEKLILLDPFGDVNKYYLIRNFLMTWGFILILVFLKAVEKRNIEFRDTMNTISWLGFIKNRRLLMLSIIASSILLMATYSQYIGLKFNPLSHYGIAFVVSYMLMLVFIGVVFLGEKITIYKIVAIILALLSMYILWLDTRV